MPRNLVRRLSAGGAVVALAAVASISSAPASAAPVASGCNLGPGGSIHHVIYVQYDNTHLTRDNPNVPSDLEQVPALKSFLTGNGSLLSNDHTILISHTAGGIVSALTGLYPDRNGIGVSNSYGVFKPDGSIDQFGAPAFTYWTDPATVLDPLPNMITTGQKNTPAPWVPFTRAGCDTGAFSIANMELENTKTTASGDITKVFGTGSPEWNFANGAAPSGQKVTDFEGIAIHCSQASSAAGLCSSAHGGKPDLLPDEPGGYTGFNGLFGAPYANQVVDQPGGFQASTADANGTASGFNDLAPAVNDVFDFSHTPGPATCSLAPDPGACPATQPIANGGVNGFPGFSPSAAQTLGYVAAMQESGIPVTYAYIRDSHDNFDRSGNCPNDFNANGPGTACYVQQLQEQNVAYRAFFNRLAADGINKSNTMFVFTVDEGDHYAGGPPTNAAMCDGVNVPCTYTPGTAGPNTVGEITTNLNQLVTTQTGDTTPFNIHFDDAPTVYVPNAPNGPPAPTDPKVRQLEREMGGLTIANPRTGATDAITQHIADRATQDILHMDNSDPLRTPSFTLFGNPDYFFQSSCASGSVTTQPGCPVVGNGFAWNHGDDNPEIARTWIGMVGPNVQTLGQTPAVWTDHTDVRPTMLAALGLTDDYASDGDVVSQVLASASLPAPISGHLASYQALEAAQKQLNAPFGRFGHDAETVSTTAVATTSTQTYDAWDAQLAGCRSVRDNLAGQIQSLLGGAAAGAGAFDDATANGLRAQAEALLGDMDALAAESAPPTGPACSAPGTHASTVVVGCAPASVRVGQAATCTATVTGATHPARSVTFSSDSGGSFGPAATCTLAVIGGDQSRCSVTYTPDAVAGGTQTISADYAGDASTAPSHGTTTIGVTPGVSMTAVACAPSPVTKGSPSTCTVTVSAGGGPAPTGQVTLARGSSGSFSATTCTLVAAAGSSSCAVDYTPATIGSHKIYANFPGDTDHLASHGSTTITAA